MSIAITSGLNDLRLQAVVDFLDLGTAPSKCRVYSGVRPYSVIDIPPIMSPMLVELYLEKPCGLVSNGVLTLEQSASHLSMVMISGEPTWARFINGNGATAFDCDAGGPDILGGHELKLSLPRIYAGGYVYITQAVIR